MQPVYKRAFKMYWDKVTLLRFKWARDKARQNGLKWYFEYDSFLYFPDKFNYFVEQSIRYPFWWRTYEWWKNSNENNPIYTHKWRK